MKKINKSIENHYYHNGLYEDIFKLLKEQGIDMSKVSRSHIEGVDEFHIRGAEVSKELVTKFNLNGLKLLDVGCGIGGPCRMLADEFGCKVTGIDMSHEFIRTAQKLTKLVQLSDRINFVQGDALDLPFEDNSFHLVWTQHVQMNIENKKQFYAEMNRVLVDGGILIYYDIFNIQNQEVTYPVPWANDKSISFLDSISNMEIILNDLGFTKTHTTDQTDKAVTFFVDLFKKMKSTGPPKLGLNLLLGEQTKEKLANVLKALEENKIELQSGIYRK